MNPFLATHKKILYIIGIVLLAGISTSTHASEKPIDIASYALGYSTCQDILTNNPRMNKKLFLKGYNDLPEQNTPLYTPVQAKEASNKLMQLIREEGARQGKKMTQEMVYEMNLPKDLVDTMSYGLGYMYSQMTVMFANKVSVEYVDMGLADCLEGKKSRFTQKEIAEATKIVKSKQSK